VIPVPTEAQEGRKFKKKPDEMHGMSRTIEYQAWDNMIGRCERQSVTDYHLYGGRGISVAKEWRVSFKAFYDCVGSRPSPNHSLDRIDTNANYEPGNVRWATGTQQNLNQRVRKDNHSGYRGVSWHKKCSKWRTTIFFRGKQVHVGTFQSKEIAANMYDQYAVQLYMDDAYTNFEYVPC